MHAIIIGEDEVAARLAALLLTSHEHVYIIVSNPHRAEELSMRFPAAMVVQGPGADAESLSAAGAREADVVYALANEDAVNIAACLLARNMFGVRRQLALSVRSCADDAYHALGIECLCGPERLARELHALAERETARR